MHITLILSTKSVIRAKGERAHTRAESKYRFVSFHFDVLGKNVGHATSLNKGSYALAEMKDFETHPRQHFTSEVDPIWRRDNYWRQSRIVLRSVSSSTGNREWSSVERKGLVRAFEKDGELNALPRIKQIYTKPRGSIIAR